MLIVRGGPSWTSPDVFFVLVGNRARPLINLNTAVASPMNMQTVDAAALWTMWTLPHG